MQAGEDKCTGCERVLYDFEVIRVGVDKLCHVCAAMEAERCRDSIAAAREEGRAAGYGEAIEKAAQKADKECALRTCRCLPNRIAADIRSLVPAATTEEPK